MWEVKCGPPYGLAYILIQDFRRSPTRGDSIPEVTSFSYAGVLEKRGVYPGPQETPRSTSFGGSPQNETYCRPYGGLRRGRTISDILSMHVVIVNTPYLYKKQRRYFTTVTSSIRGIPQAGYTIPQHVKSKEIIPLCVRCVRPGVTKYACARGSELPRGTPGYKLAPAKSAAIDGGDPVRPTNP